MSRHVPVKSFALLIAAWAGFHWVPCQARVDRIEIQKRESYAEGRNFEGIGPYERLLGKVYFSVDPKLPANRPVVDLDLAPRNAEGRVEFSADLEILAPVDKNRANGTVLYDVNNRGNRLALGQFNTRADEFLMRRGYVVVWSGWIAEVLPGGDRLRLDAPVATEPGGSPIVGLVRAEMAPDQPAERLNIAHWANQGSYVPTENGMKSATLTRRLREKDARQPIARDQFSIEVQPKSADHAGGLPQVDLVLLGGFEPGFLYELIYEAQGPIVQGLGLAGIRDLVSHLKYGTDADHPLAAGNGSAAKRAIGFGVSQSGRCLRMLLYDGFNADEEGRQVFDGLFPHVAGAGLGFFNHRFASPTRHNGQHDNHSWPADVFPFTYGDETDPFTGVTDGILRRARASGTVPRIMHVQTAAEYWHRSGSLVHTDPLGTRDAEIPAEVRIYAIGGAQHGPGDDMPRSPTTGQLAHNPTDYRPLMRALLTALDRWIQGQGEPPPSRYPRVSDGTLGGWHEEETGWSAIDSVPYPTVIQQPEMLDYGTQFASLRRLTQHPPASRGDYRVLVPACGTDNNNRGMLDLPFVAVPLGTFTGWNLRSLAIGAPTELLGLAGGYIPFAKTVQARAAGDSRPALDERYGGFADYLSRFREAGQELVDEGYLLRHDLQMLLERAEERKDLFASQPSR
jgi:hypothetical protein